MDLFVSASSGALVGLTLVVVFQLGKMARLLTEIRDELRRKA